MKTFFQPQIIGHSQDINLIKLTIINLMIFNFYENCFSVKNVTIFVRMFWRRFQFAGKKSFPYTCCGKNIYGNFFKLNEDVENEWTMKMNTKCLKNRKYSTNNHQDSNRLFFITKNILCIQLFKSRLYSKLGLPDIKNRYVYEYEKDEFFVKN
jgi:hypothetical protein